MRTKQSARPSNTRRTSGPFWNTPCPSSHRNSMSKKPGSWLEVRVDPVPWVFEDTSAALDSLSWYTKLSQKAPRSLKLQLFGFLRKTGRDGFRRMGRTNFSHDHLIIMGTEPIRNFSKEMGYVLGRSVGIVLGRWLGLARPDGISQTHPE